MLWQVKDDQTLVQMSATEWVVSLKQVLLPRFHFSRMYAAVFYNNKKAYQYCVTVHPVLFH